MKEVLKDESNALEKTLEKISNLLEVKNSILDNDYVQLIGDTSKIIGLFRSASELILKKKFESFLKGFSINEKPTEIQLEKLKEYIDDETKAEFVADTFSKILLSNSSKACVILGTILKDIVESRDSVSHEQLIAINALKDYFDIDIDNFKIIHSIFAEKKERKIGLIDILSKIKKDELDDISILMTLDKAAASQLLFSTTAVHMPEKMLFESRKIETDTFYVIPESGELLATYINRYV